MRRFIPVKDQKMVRDSYSKALLNIDLEEVKAYQNRRSINERTTRLENEINTIKDILGKILEKLN